MYGRGTASVAEQIGASMEEAQELVDKFFSGFPTVKDWIERTKESAHKIGYVEDILGRRRRLPDIQLPRYQVIDKSNSSNIDFNPLLETRGLVSSYKNPKIQYYEQALSRVKSRREFNDLVSKAAKECPDIELKDNTGFIAQAERQCVNARVQGGAGSITKTAMISVAKDPILQSYGFRTLICVHDEIIGECKKEFAEEAGKRLSQVMIESAATLCDVPMKCDTYCISRWYEDDFSDYIYGKYEDAIKEGKSEQEAQDSLVQNYPMINPVRLIDMMQGTYECNRYEAI